jgi:hypothetical protein
MQVVHRQGITLCLGRTNSLEILIANLLILNHTFSIYRQIRATDRLNQVMKEAFNEVTKKARIKVKFNQNLTKTQLYAHGAQDRDWFLAMFQSLFKGSPTNGYQRRLERHREYFGQ